MFFCLKEVPFLGAIFIMLKIIFVMFLPEKKFVYLGVTSCLKAFIW
jgi:hypothetical protein